MYKNKMMGFTNKMQDCLSENDIKAIKELKESLELALLAKKVKEMRTK